MSVTSLSPHVSSRQLPASEGRSRTPLVIACLIYIPLAAAITIRARHNLNPDGVAYVRIAKYYAEANFELAVTGYWSPLLSWLIALAHVTGRDPLLVAHAISAVAGVLMIAAVWRLTQLFRVAGPVAKVMPTAAAFLALSWIGWGIVADPLMAALLTWYFVFNYRMCRTLRARHAVAAGVMAGICYLAKYYALPFFLLHCFLSVFVLAKRRRRWLPVRKQVACFGICILSCAVVAGPWIVALFVKYGRPTFATSGRVLHGMVAPNVPEGRYFPLCRLGNPRPGRVTVWENPDETEHDWPEWSAVGSVSEMLHQLRLMYRNVRRMAMLLFQADGFGMIYGSMLVLPVMAIMPRRRAWGIDRWCCRWVLLLVASYLSGLLFVFADSRRYYWPLQGVLLTLVGMFVMSISRSVLSTGDLQRGERRWGARLLAALIVLACLLRNAELVRRAVVRPNIDVIKLAEDLRARNVSGPYVANHWNQAVVLAYHWETPFCGVPAPKSAGELTEQLRHVSATNLLIFKGEHRPAAAANVERFSAEISAPSVTVRRGGLEVSVYPIRRLLGAKKPSGQR